MLKESFETMLPDLPRRQNVLSWYLYKDFYEYFTWLINDENLNGKDGYKHSVKEKLHNYFISNGMEIEWIDYSIIHFSKCELFDTADSRFNNFIIPIINKINKNQLDKIMEAINENYQIYGRRRAYSDNTKLVNMISARLNLDDSYFSNYENFNYNKDNNNIEF